MNLNARKTWMWFGVAGGLALVRALPEFPQHSGVIADRRDDIWEGVAWGVGFGCGIIAGMNLLILGSQQGYRKQAIRRRKAMAQGSVSPPGAAAPQNSTASQGSTAAQDSTATQYPATTQSSGLAAPEDNQVADAQLEDKQHGS
jgi:hypothetical protein